MSAVVRAENPVPRCETFAFEGARVDNFRVSGKSSIFERVVRHFSFLFFDTVPRLLLFWRGVLQYIYIYIFSGVLMGDFWIQHQFYLWWMFVFLGELEFDVWVVIWIGGLGRGNGPLKGTAVGGCESEATSQELFFLQRKMGEMGWSLWCWWMAGVYLQNWHCKSLDGWSQDWSRKYLDMHSCRKYLFGWKKSKQKRGRLGEEDLGWTESLMHGNNCIENV